MFLMLKQFMQGGVKFALIDILRGTSIMKVLKELHVHQYLPAEELQAIRQKRLNGLFRLAITSTRYYKNFKQYDELPILTKDMIAERFDDFFSITDKNKLIRKTTGGSTGVPFAYYTTKKAQSYMWAGIILSWEMTGYLPGEKVVFLAGSSMYRSGWKHQLFYKLLNVDLLYASPLNDAVIRKYAEKIRKNKAAVLYGYSYAINTMAEYLNRVQDHSFPHLKGVVCTAELLTDSARKKIELAFGVPVFDQYGCNEGGISAFECEQKKMHLISTRALCETDENGILFSTDLINDGFIMMKYNTTDIVEFSDEPCACKRNFPVIKKMIGRLNDVVVDMDHKVLHASFFGIALSKDSSIHQYQVTFNNNAINLNIHSTHYDKDYYSNKYLPLVQKYARFDRYTVTMNAVFEKTPNGKHREVVDKRKVKEYNYTE
jgi:phenylacetate-CoA ligase